jgi:hypothetical protein
MTDDKLLPFDLSAVRRKKLTVDFEGGNQSSNGGLLLLRHSGQARGVRAANDGVRREAGPVQTSGVPRVPLENLDL